MAIFALTLVQPAYPQKLSDTLHISEISIYSPRKLKLTGLTYTQVDSFVLNDKMNNSLSEVLSEHTPVFIKTYGRGALASASFRGTSPSHTKVTWNDIELNSPMLGMVDFSLIPMFFVDNVEILHGGSSVSGIKGALGGLISLSTEPEWNKNFSVLFLQGAGSFGSNDAYLKLYLGNKQWSSQTRIFYSHSDNDYKFINTDILDSVDLVSGKKYHPEMKNRDAMFTSYGILQEFNFRPSEKNFFNISIWGQNSSRSIPQLSTNESGLNNNINRDDNLSLRGVVSYKHYAGKGSFKLLSGVNLMDLDFTLQNRLSDSTIFTEINSASYSSGFFNRVGYSLEINESTNLEISAGVDYHQVNSNEKVLQYGYQKNRLQSNLMATIVKSWSPRWRNNISLSSEMIDKKLTPLSFIAGIEFHILPDEKLYLNAAVGSNAKYPSLNDLYFQPGGNTSLKSELSINREVGMHFKQELNKAALSSQVTLYSTQVQNWILWLPTFKGYWEPDNIKAVNVKGLETSVDLSGNAGTIGYKMKGSYALTRSVNLQESPNPEDKSYGKQLPFIPVHSANYVLNIDYRKWSFAYLWNFYSERYTTTSNYTNSGRDVLYPYFMSQAGLNKKFEFKDYLVELNFKIYNLFNEKYRSVLQRPMPGRNFQVQLKVKI